MFSLLLINIVNASKSSVSSLLKLYSIPLTTHFFKSKVEEGNAKEKSYYFQNMLFIYVGAI